MTLARVLLHYLPSLNFFSMPLSENKTQEVPNDFLSLMVTLSKYSLTDEANEIVSEHEDEETRITELQKLLESAPNKLDAKLRRVAANGNVIERISFQRLKMVLQIYDVLKKRDAFIALLEDHGLDYKRLSV